MTPKKITYILLISISLIILYFITSMWIDGLRIWGKGNIEYDKTGQVGDFIGGVIGTIINGAAFYFLYLTLNEQRITSEEQRRTTEEQKNSFIKERFESKFFDLIELHRANVSELKYLKKEGNSDSLIENREVFKALFQEFIECWQEVRKYSNSKIEMDYFKPKYRTKLEKIRMSINPKINLIEFLIIDVAWSIFFYGCELEGTIIIKNNFIRKCNDAYLNGLINYLRLKPDLANIEGFRQWKKLQSMDYLNFKLVTDEIYRNRDNTDHSNLLITSQEILRNLTTNKYYTGHQSKLGHYFRHLFQSYKYLNEQSFLNEKEKYFYGKTFRAQLSTYEQALLFINSISSLGMKWDITSETLNDKLITKFNLVKNLPGRHMLGIRYKNYYPLVEYETDEHIF